MRLIDWREVTEDKVQDADLPCWYPDWEGGQEVGKHVVGQDGYCCVCGEKVSEAKP